MLIILASISGRQKEHKYPFNFQNLNDYSLLQLIGKDVVSRVYKLMEVAIIQGKTLQGDRQGGSLYLL